MHEPVLSAWSIIWPQKEGDSNTRCDLGEPAAPRAHEPVTKGQILMTTVCGTQTSQIRRDEQLGPARGAEESFSPGDRVSVREDEGAQETACLHGNVKALDSMERALKND